MMRAMTARRHRWHPVVLASGVAALAGMAAAVEPLAGALVAACAVSALASLQWRAGVKALLFALPFAGVPVFIAGDAGQVVRDLFIVAPLYAAFGLAMLRDSDPVLPPMRFVWALIADLAILALLYVAIAPSLLAGIVGVRVWLAYIPMAAIGYRYVRQTSDYESALKLTAVLGLAPAVLAVAEWAFATQAGDFGPLEMLYGAVDLGSHRFVVLSMPFGAEHLMIPRVPATFTSVSQYYGFAMVAFSAGLAMALRRGGDWWWCAAALACGALASGARVAYIAVPGLSLLAFLLAGPSRRQIALVVAGVVGLAAVVLLTAGPLAFAEAMAGHVQVTLRHAWEEMRGSLHPIGHGTGWDTNAALRYGGIQDRRFVENWYAKAALELGIPGLVLIVAAFGAIAASLLRRLRIARGDVRRLAAPVVALLLMMMVALFKGPYVDLDPLNVYFWLFIGMTAGALGMPRDDRPADGAAAAGGAV